ncbi:MFS transporter [Arthrobacter sp. FW306-05-C]|uniref:MFS transporter n=1 Tax=Arthrobacter TaxID=1663 RepID=UPI001EF069EC|nr:MULTISPECIES: MFS transporter [Arthrobacter]MDP9986408.1 MFS family permease [Arthrobacter oryzae]UKA65860.1 MFS transporter [Arthrobacter sp. FW306-05-C]UKA70222.1 MFS transporter [Arthrobacter sp. FW306-06-A]UKA74523.1 MFS transporter [Arthrobacter sp. FW306-07-I]
MRTSGNAGGALPAAPMTAVRFILAFGIISALMDMVYEGARSVTGPFLGALGASALLISVVTGAGEAVALVLRLVFGRLADRPGLRWALAISGYALTAVSVPLLGVTDALWVACLLVLAERLGKAVRSPAKDTMLAEAGSALGQGKAFALHEALDQVGALVGPLLVGVALALSGSYGPGFLLLAVPGLAAMLVLFWLKRRVPDPGVYELAAAQPGNPQPAGGVEQADAEPPGAERNAAIPVPGGAAGMPRQYWLYAAFSSLTMFGYATFGLLSFHLVATGLLPPALVPVLYAAAMGVDAVAALGSGWLFDRVGLRVLLVLPVLAAAVPWLGFSNNTGLAVAGVLVWGASMGMQESTMRAGVAGLAPANKRGSAYGMFTACYGLAWLAGSFLIGLLYQQSVFALAVTVTVVQAAALAIFAVVRPGRSGDLTA